MLRVPQCRQPRGRTCVRVPVAQYSPPRHRMFAPLQRKFGLDEDGKILFFMRFTGTAASSSESNTWQQPLGPGAGCPKGSSRLTSAFTSGFTFRVLVLYRISRAWATLVSGAAGASSPQAPSGQNFAEVAFQHMLATSVAHLFSPTEKQLEPLSRISAPTKHPI